MFDFRTISWYLILQSCIWSTKVFNRLAKLLLGASTFSGKVVDRQNSFRKFRRSAHRLRVVWGPCPPSNLSPPLLSHFYLAHVSYEDPVECVAKRPNVTLMNVVDGLAVFAVVPETVQDIYDLKAPWGGPFVYGIQRRLCREIITVPLHFVPELADQVVDCCGTVAIVWNPSRCGSTLLCQMLSPVPWVTIISEPDFMTYTIESGKGSLFDKYGGHSQSSSDLDILRALIKLQSKPVTKTNGTSRSHSSSVVVIKPRSQALSNLYLFQETKDSKGQTIRHLFMHRDPCKNVASIHSMLSAGLRSREAMAALFSPTIKALVFRFDPERCRRLQALMEGAKDDQDQALAFYVAHLLCFYLNTRGSLGREVTLVQYEELLQDPQAQLERLLLILDPDHLSRQRHDGVNVIQACLEAGQEDSQGKHEMLSRSRLSKFKCDPASIPSRLGKVLAEVGLPPLDQLLDRLAPDRRLEPLNQLI